jgi:hypothetical protein
MSLHNINGSNYGDHHQESEINIWKQKNNLKLGKVVPIGLGAIAVLNLLMAGMSQYSINRIKNLDRVGRNCPNNQSRFTVTGKTAIGCRNRPARIYLHQRP